MSLSNVEALLSALLNGETVNISPGSRIETYLLALVSGNTDVPNPQSRSEAYLYALCKSGLSGGGAAAISEDQTYILVDESGNEVAAVMVDEETVFDATANDIREGKTAATEEGVTVGTKVIPTYHTTQAATLIPVGSELQISPPDVDMYDYTKLQVIVCNFDSTISRSVATEKVVIDDNVYAVNSVESISTITKNVDSKTIDFGITNTGDVPVVLRYFTYKEII